MEAAPCWGCAERAAGCHANCKKYGAYRAEVDRRRERRSAQRIEDDQVMREMERMKKRRLKS